MDITDAIKQFSEAFAIKKAYIFDSIILSSVTSFFVDKMVEQYNSQDLTIPLTALILFTFLTFLFITVDLVTGIIAARKEGEVIISKKWGTTVAKVFGIMMYLALCIVVLFIAPLTYIVYALVYGPLILSILREYISIGENIERIYGKKSYVFNVIDRIFNIFEGKFFKILTKESFKKDDNSQIEDDFSEEEIDVKK